TISCHRRRRVSPKNPSDAVELLVLPKKTDVATLYIVVSCIHIEEEEMTMNNEKILMVIFSIISLLTVIHILIRLTRELGIMVTNFEDGHECELKMFLRPIQGMGSVIIGLSQAGQVGWIGSAGKNESAGSDGVSEVQVVEPKWVNDAPHERIGSLHTSSDYMVTHKLNDSTKTSSVKALTEMRVTSLKPVLHRWQKTIVWLHGNQKRNGYLQSTSSRNSIMTLSQPSNTACVPKDNSKKRTASESMDKLTKR
nr:DREB2 transcription factor [Tanacetum cinerariifolium]